MSKPLLLSIGNGKVQELVGTAESQVPVWDATLSEWQAAAVPGGGGGGGVTSVGLTGGTSGLVIGGTASPITTSGTFELDAPHRFAFDTVAPVEVAAAGQVSYNAADGSLEQMLDGGHVKSVIGQTLHQRVLNDTGSTLTKGQVVYVSGAQGNRVTVALAEADADSTSATIIGIVAYAIADGDEGFVITEGIIKGVNTLGYTEGLPVYLSPTTAGGLTQTKPTAPEHLVLVGYCVRASSTVGEILVKTQNGYELSELHDVYINAPTSGQILIYDATSGQTRWENASLGASNGVAVTPGAGSLSVGLDATSSPTLTGLTLSGLTASRFVVTNGSSALSSQQYVSLSSEVSGTLPAANGGTAQSTWTTGDLLYASAANTLAKRPIGSTGQILTVVAGVPTWAAPATSGTVTSVSLNTGTTGLTVGGVTNIQITSSGSFNLGGTLAVANGGTGKSYAGENGVVKVLGGVFQTASDIVDGDVSLSAGILRSKLASGSAWTLIANNGSGVMTEVASTGTSGQVLTSNGASALPTFQALPSVPYDVSGEVGGTPSISTEVFHFKAVRAWSLAASGHQGGQVTDPSSDVVCTVSKNASSIGTITFGSSGTFSSSITATSFAIGDVLKVTTPSAVNAISNPYFTFVGTVG